MKHNPLIRIAGLSLTEILIAITLSVFVITGMLKVLDSVKSSQNLNDAISQSQEAGRFALNILTDAVQQSGYFGCEPPLTFTPTEEDTVDWTNLNGKSYIKPVAVFPSTNLSQTSLRAFSVSTGGSLTPNPSANPLKHDDDIQQLTNLAHPPKPNTHILNVQHASTSGAALTQDMASSSADITIGAGLAGINQFTALIIGDCSKADLFRVSNVPSNTPPIVLKHEGPDPTTNSSPALNNTYKMQSATVRFFRNDTYYIADTGRTDSLGQPISALMRLDVNDRTEEIIEGVEQLKLVFGEMMTGGSLRSVNAGEPMNTRKVTQVHISITTKSLKKANDPDAPYLEKVHQRSVQLRNRS